MYHILNENTLFDISNSVKLEVNISKGKSKADLSQLLDDVSVWMDSKRDMLGEKYLPFSVIAIGLSPSQVSSFMYGYFVGKAMEKHGISISVTSTKVDRDAILKEIDLSSRESNHDTDQ